MSRLHSEFMALYRRWSALFGSIENEQDIERAAVYEKIVESISFIMIQFGEAMRKTPNISVPQFDSHKVVGRNGEADSLRFFAAQFLRFHSLLCCSMNVFLLGLDNYLSLSTILAHVNSIAHLFQQQNIDLLRIGNSFFSEQAVLSSISGAAGLAEETIVLSGSTIEKSFTNVSKAAKIAKPSSVQASAQVELHEENESVIDSNKTQTRVLSAEDDTVKSSEKNGCELCGNSIASENHILCENHHEKALKHWRVHDPNPSTGRKSKEQLRNIHTAYADYYRKKEAQTSSGSNKKRSSTTPKPAEKAPKLFLENNTVSFGGEENVSEPLFSTGRDFTN